MEGNGGTVRAFRSVERQVNVKICAGNRERNRGGHLQLLMKELRTINATHVANFPVALNYTFQRMERVCPLSWCWAGMAGANDDAVCDVDAKGALTSSHSVGDKGKEGSNRCDKKRLWSQMAKLEEGEARNEQRLLLFLTDGTEDYAEEIVDTYMPRNEDGTRNVSVRDHLSSSALRTISEKGAKFQVRIFSLTMGHETTFLPVAHWLACEGKGHSLTCQPLLARSCSEKHMHWKRMENEGKWAC